jgi:serralysin
LNGTDAFSQSGEAMANETLKFCFEQIIAPEYKKSAAEKAIAENPANASPFEAAAVRSKLWSPGRTLHVTFLDGSSEIQAEVAHFALQWCDYANIRFEFGVQAHADIRISFTKVGS